MIYIECDNEGEKNMLKQLKPSEENSQNQVGNFTAAKKATIYSMRTAHTNALDRWAKQCFNNIQINHIWIIY